MKNMKCFYWDWDQERGWLGSMILRERKKWNKSEKNFMLKNVWKHEMFQEFNLTVEKLRMTVWFCRNNLI